MRSLRSKFILFILAILILLLLILNTYPIVSVRDTIFEEKHNAMSSQASVVSSALSGLVSLSPDAISDVLRFLDLENYDGISVADSTGTVIYKDGNYSPESEDLSAALHGKSVFRASFENAAFESRISVPIGNRNVIVGAASLFSRDTDEAEVIITIQQRIVFLSLVIGSAALLLAILFSHIVLGRLDDLTQSMHTVAGGNYTYRHAIRGRDELSQLGKEFNQLTERLETNEELRRRFVSDASHELKTPIASIRLLSDSILQDQSMDAVVMREFVTDIEHEALRLQRTTNKLLDLSRLDDGVQIVPEPVDLKQVTLDVIPLLTPLALSRSVNLRTHLDDGCVIMGNAEDMARVISNLVENAIKYNVPSGRVTVRLEQNAKEVLLTVEDTGIGIPDEDQYNIFTRFYRVDKARSRQSGGSGLGLSIVHDAVIAHGGTIRVGHNRPQGSVFILSFPRPSSEETGI